MYREPNPSTLTLGDCIRVVGESLTAGAISGILLAVPHVNPIANALLSTAACSGYSIYSVRHLESRSSREVASLDR
jgi:hypothetical protein